MTRKAVHVVAILHFGMSCVELAFFVALVYGYVGLEEKLKSEGKFFSVWAGTLVYGADVLLTLISAFGLSLSSYDETHFQRRIWLINVWIGCGSVHVLVMFVHVLLFNESMAEKSVGIGMIVLMIIGLVIVLFYKRDMKKLIVLSHGSSVKAETTV